MGAVSGHLSKAIPVTLRTNLYVQSSEPSVLHQVWALSQPQRIIEKGIILFYWHACIFWYGKIKLSDDKFYILTTSDMGTKRETEKMRDKRLIAHFQPLLFLSTLHRRDKVVNRKRIKEYQQKNISLCLLCISKPSLVIIFSVKRSLRSLSQKNLPAQFSPSCLETAACPGRHKPRTYFLYDDEEEEEKDGKNSSKNK